MNCSNAASSKCDNQTTFTDDSDEIERSFYQISQKNESSCFSDYFCNLSDADNILGIEHLQMDDIINQSNICYWKNRRKTPKFLHEYYLLGDTIGKGSYGKVKDCVDIRTMKRYAMKIVHRMKIKKIPGGMKHVENEINLMKTLSHENIVRLVYDFQELEPERRCLVMEFCLGSIHDLQTNGILESSNQFRCLPEWQTRHYFIQIVEGMQYLHNQGLIHKDMKPGNFLLTEHDSVKITDFGVSERLAMFQMDSTISGGQTTPAIQPPELALGSPNICGFKLDIYGTGVSLYFMLCGRVPFSNSNILLIFDEIAAGEYVIPDWVSTSASDLIRNMMCKDVNVRFDIKKIKCHNWYIHPGERLGEKVDPKVHLNYAARDRAKENLYRLSTGMPSAADSSDPELLAIMPMTVTSRLRTYYNWPMTEDEENAEIDENLIIGEDFIGMDGSAILANNAPPSPHGIRFFINNSEQQRRDTDSNGDPDTVVHVPQSLSLSQSAFGHRDLLLRDGSDAGVDDEGRADSQRDTVSRHTLPMAACTSAHHSSSTHSDKKSSFKSKLKLGRRITRCTQS